MTYFVLPRCVTVFRQAHTLQILNQVSFWLNKEKQIVSSLILSSHKPIPTDCRRTNYKIFHQSWSCNVIDERTGERCWLSMYDIPQRRWELWQSFHKSELSHYNSGKLETSWSSFTETCKQWIWYCTSRCDWLLRWQSRSRFVGCHHGSGKWHDPVDVPRSMWKSGTDSIFILHIKMVKIAIGP